MRTLPLTDRGLTLPAIVTLVLLTLFAALVAGASVVSAQGTVPDTPDQAIATAVFVGGVDLEWNDVPGADSYDVQLYRNGQWIDLPGEGVEIAFYGAGAIISGLDPDSTLWFQVRAENVHGSSDWSNFNSLSSTSQFRLGRRARPDNVPASGAPVINGTAQVGESLTADTTGIEDGNGLDRVQFRFQWVSSDGTTDTDIQSATESTYTLKTADTDRTVSARVAFTDRGGYAESLTGTATEQVAPSAHANPAPTPEPAQNSPATGSPAVTGTAQVGETLSADISRIGDADGLANVSYSYQWVRNDGTSDTDITDAADSSYTLVAADDGKTIKVRVSFTDDEANEETLISTATEAVSFAVQQQIVNSSATGAPTIGGTAQVGETLTVDTSDIADDDGLNNVTFSYQWIRNDGNSDTDITSETDSTYTLVDADEGKTIKVRVSFTDDVDHEETLTSKATATVGAAPNNPATGTLSISGTAEVGETLAADTTGIADADGLNGVTFSYQWISNDGTADTDVTDATDSSYTLVSADEGKTIKVRVSFTDDAANEESLTSAATGAVAAAVVAAPSSYITVAVTEDSSDPDNIVTNFTVTWSDSDDCSTNYNIYLAVWTGPGVGQTTRTHIGSAASGSTQATLPIPYSGGNSFIAPRVKVELYCGEYAEDSSQNDLVASTGLSMQYSDLRSGTFSSAPLTALSVGSRTLSPSFNRGKIRYGVDVPSDERRVTLSPTALTGYEFVYVRNPIWGVVMGCDVRGCHYSYGDGTTTGIVLADVDPNTSGFQVDLDGGENQLGIGVNKGDEDAGPGSLYYLTVTVENVPATGRPTVSGTTQVGQTLTADTSGISDEDGLDDVNFSYQWIRVNSDSTETDIAGATRYTYTLASADADKTIKVRVTFADDAGNEESLTSASTSAVTQVAALSTDATLRALTLSGVNFGTFESATTSYTARVSNTVPETTVAPTLNHSGASYVTKLGGVTDADGVISLSEGSNVITVEVTAEDGQTAKTYTITVTRLDSQSSPISSDATLSGLALSGINFGTFASGTTSYSITVANSVSQTTVAPTVNHSEASHVIKLGGVTDADGTVSLAVGNNVITVEVTAEDRSTTQTYTVTVTRADPPSTDATLRALIVDGRNMGGGRGPYYWVGYLISVNYSVTEATVTPTVNHSGASYVIKLNGVEDADGTVSLAVGNNVITVEVTAEDGETTLTYRVSFKRRALTVSGITSSDYAENGTESVATYAVAGAGTSTITWSLSGDDSGDFSISSAGVLSFSTSPDYESPVDADTDNVYQVTIQASDGTNTATLDVTVTVTRLVSLQQNSTDATLSGLSLSGVNFGTFTAGTTSYSAQVANSVTQTTVTPTVNDSNASYVSKLGGVTDADGTVSLAVGSNVITVEVTAEDEQTTKTYTVTVTRAASSTDATLEWLALSGIDIGNGLGHRDYPQTQTSFTASVYNSVSQTTVTAAPNHTAASYVIKLGGVTDADGTVSLAVGRNVITVEVTAEDGQTTKSYTAPVTRASGSAPTTGELATDDPQVNFHTISYTHSFVALTLSYPRNRGITGVVTQRYKHDGDSFVSAGADGRYENTFDDDLGGLNLSWTYTEPEPDTLYKWVAKMLNSQSATVIEASLTVRTPPEPGTTILSSDATLSDLTLSDVDFEAVDRAFVSEGFHSTVTSYVGSAANSVTETTVTPTVNDSGASYAIKLGGVTDSDGTVSLAVGSNVITVEVTAEDGETSRTYTVTVTREQAPTPEKSSDATLSALALSGVNFGTFDSTTISYSARVANSVTQTTVTPTVNHSGASYVIKLGGVEDADGTVSLTVGSNTITIEVTAEDDSTTKSYTVTVTRVPNTPATGAPTISSTAEVGQTLTARTSGISDDDGLDNATYAYQWIRTEGTTDTDIAGATETTYLVTTDDVDRALGVRISFTDDAGNQESLTSAATVSVAARPNTPTPDAPDQPIATAVFVGGVDLEWNDVPGADSYDVQLYRNGQWIDLPGEGVEIAFYGAGAIISGLDPDSTLWFQVRAKNAHSSSDWSNFSSVASTSQFKLGRRARPDNVPASGAPVINGTAQVGESLTADTTGIEDGNGLDRVQFRFQWVSYDGSADTDIASATDSTYTLAASDEGKTIRVRVAFTDRGGYAESMTSSATATVAAAPNSPATGAPVISGTAEVGKTLTADTSDIADADGLSGATFTYQWIANDGSADTDIQDATDSTYTLVADDEGKTVKVRVSFTDDAENVETLTSTATNPVAARPNSAATGAPTINGTVQVGETLTADTAGIADTDGLTNVTFSYQWIRNDGNSDTDITSETESTYILVAADEGKTIKVRVTFTDDAGDGESLTSTATATVTARPNTPATGAPIISGTAQVGETLTADTSGISDVDGLDSVSFSYQWLSSRDTEISGATDATHILAASDEGKTIKVRVSFTDDGYEETLTSTATEAVSYATQQPPTARPDR